jgi:hypothetical protein
MGDVSSEVVVPLSQQPGLIRFAPCSHKRMSSFGDLAKSNCRADCGETQNLLAEIQPPLHHGETCWTCTDGAGLGKRSTGRKMGDHGKHSFECPMPIIQNPGAKNKVQRSRAAGDISGSARRESDIHRRGSSASNLDLMFI